MEKCLHTESIICWFQLPMVVAPFQGTMAPLRSESDGSGTTRSGSISRR